MKPYVDNIDKATTENNNYRNAVFTNKMQLVLMSLEPLEDIGFEVHHGIDQFFRIESGIAAVYIDGQVFKLKKDDAFVVPAGSRHNVANRSKSRPLKLYTVYSKPTHPAGVIEPAKIEEH